VETSLETNSQFARIDKPDMHVLNVPMMGPGRFLVSVHMLRTVLRFSGEQKTDADVDFSEHAVRTNRY
jgi:hypothetical protein